MLALGAGDPVVEYESCESSSEAVSFGLFSPPVLDLLKDRLFSTSDDVDTRFPPLRLKK